MHIKLVNGNHSLNVLAMCNMESSISFVDNTILSTLQLQGRKASLSVAGIHESQDVKTEIVPIATVQIYIHEKLKLSHQIVDLQGLKDRNPHLKNSPKQLQSKRSSSSSWARLL